MMPKIRLFIDPIAAKEKIIETPADWDEMNDDEQREYCEEEALAWMSRVVKFGGEVVNQ
jgi:hypothetical protein